MKKLLKTPFTLFLAILARSVVRKYRPQIVMVTGSVGKTSTKDAVAAVLSARFFLRASEKSFNSEFGVPLTIFGTKNPWLNPIGWLGVLKSALALLILPSHYPNLLVLEVGADRPGDLKRIMRITTPKAVVVTRLPEIPVHVEAYASPEALREEEFLPAQYLPDAAPLVFSTDDEFAIQMASYVPAQPITYGTSQDAHVRLSDIDFYSEEGRVLGMQAKVTMGSEEAVVIVRGSVGKTQVLPAAAALALASTFGMTLEESITALESYEPPPGRGRLFAGTNGSVLVDESYNSSPAALEEALQTLQKFPGKRKIAVMGDMLELGRYSVMEHERIGALAATCADLVVTIGIRARRIGEAAIAAGKPAAQCIAYDNSTTAAAALATLVEPGDVVMIKGSQSVRTERIVAALLADPADLPRLVRQDAEWSKR